MKETTGLTQAKELLMDFDNRSSWLERSQFVVTEFVIGHSILREHPHKLGIPNNATVEFCGT